MISGFFESLAWAPHVLAIEIKKLVSYRVAFWVRYILGTLTEVLVAYFLWDAIFTQSGAQSLHGFSFHGIVFYYVFSALVGRMIQTAEQGGISDDIYQGGLTRYLLYPLSFLQYKYVGFFGQQLTGFLQLGVGFGIAAMIWGLPADQNITVGSFIMGMGTTLLAGCLMFLMNACLELIAFWQDTVWNLMAMLRFIGNLLGGVLFPLVFFPEWGQRFVQFTPFPLLFSFPVRCYLGQVDATEWVTKSIQLCGWIFMVSLLLSWIWKKGTRVYSGVGI